MFYKLRKRLYHMKRIKDDLKFAKKKHPNFPKDLIHAIAIMAEESGEAVRAANNYQHENSNIFFVYEELYQTAAMCLRCLEMIDKIRNETM